MNLNAIRKKMIEIPLTWPMIHSYQNSFNPLKRNEKIVFFDMDNTLYQPSTGIDKLMVQRIELYCEKLGLNESEAKEVSRKYYSTYGLAIRGFVKHHNVDPVEYDDFVDGGLQLEEKLKPNYDLANMISGLKARKFIFTNAGLKHTNRVLNLIGIRDCFDGILYCDYSVKDFHCKPELSVFEMAMRLNAVEDPSQCYFIDDSIRNILVAKQLGWNVVLLKENQDASISKEQITINNGVSTNGVQNGICFDIKTIHSASQLPLAFPELA